MGLHNSIIEPHNSIMELHNSIYGAPLQIMQLYVNYGAPSPFTEVHESLCIKIEVHGAPQFNVHGLGWIVSELITYLSLRRPR